MMWVDSNVASLRRKKVNGMMDLLSLTDKLVIPTPLKHAAISTHTIVSRTHTVPPPPRKNPELNNKAASLILSPRFFPRPQMGEDAGTTPECLFIGCFFSSSLCRDVSRCLPQVFYQVILSCRQARTAALFLLRRGDGGDRKSRPRL